MSSRLHRALQADLAQHREHQQPTNAVKPYRLPLESATKDELIAAIRARWPFEKTIDEIERNLYFSRCATLIQTMQEACDEMQANRNGGFFDRDKWDRWLAASEKWKKANAALARLQKTNAEKCGQSADNEKAPGDEPGA